MSHSTTTLDDCIDVYYMQRHICTCVCLRGKLETFVLVIDHRPSCGQGFSRKGTLTDGEREEETSIVPWSAAGILLAKLPTEFTLCLWRPIDNYNLRSPLTTKVNTDNEHELQQ